MEAIAAITVSKNRDETIDQAIDLHRVAKQEGGIRIAKHVQSRLSATFISHHLNCPFKNKERQNCSRNFIQIPWFWAEASRTFHAGSFSSKEKSHCNSSLNV